jgi:hypothetical protein
MVALARNIGLFGETGGFSSEIGSERKLGENEDPEKE